MSNRSTAKTPYEIRLDLLQLAFDILVQQHQAKCNPNSSSIITSPTTEDVIREADKMNAFISTAPQSH